MIYAIGITGNKYVKIGYTSSDTVDKRIAELQTGCPYKLWELVSISGTLKQEQTLHHQLKRTFTAIHLPIPPNEWYPGRHPIFKKFLEELEYGFDAAMGFLLTKDPSGKRRSSKTPDDGLKLLLKWPKSP